MKIANLLLTVIGVCSAVTAAAFVTIKTPAFADSFADSGAALPEITRFFLVSSEGSLQLGCGILAFLLIVKEPVVENQRKKLMLSTLGSIVALAALLGYFWAMSLPEQSLNAVI